MVKKSIFCLIAVVLLISVAVLAACNRNSKSVSTTPPAPPETTTTPKTPAPPETSTTPKTPAATTSIVWSPDVDCAVCHVMQSYVDSLQDSSLMVYVHSQKGFVCLDCHDQQVLAEVHTDVNSNATSDKSRGLFRRGASIRRGQISRCCLLNWFRKASGLGGTISNLIFRSPRNGSRRDLLSLSLYSSALIGWWYFSG